MEETRNRIEAVDDMCPSCGILPGQIHLEGCSIAIARYQNTFFPEDFFDKVYDNSNKPEGLKYDTGKQQWFAMPLEVLEPLADVFAAGEKKYATFNCLLPFEESSRRFYDGQMRHAKASQCDPLAIDDELLEKYGLKVFHQAQIAFNALMRLYHARKEQNEVLTQVP